VIEFDDLNGDIQPYSKLKTAITDESVSGRILGSTKEVMVSTRTLILSSGNNVDPVRDMSRRVLTINLDPRCETPAERVFKNPNLLSDVKAKRGQLVSDCLTIVRGWIVAGRPKAELPSLASFNQWSDLCRQPLVWLGLADPAAKIFEQMKDDPDAELLGRFLDAWAFEIGSSAVMVRDLCDRWRDYGGSALAQLISEIAEERGGAINRARLGRWIKRHQGRFIGDMRLIPEKNGRNASAWKLSGMSGLSGNSSQSLKVSNSYENLDEIEIVF
jgi:hypothetical protein